MGASLGFRTALNQIRELSSPLYHRYIPEINENTSINELFTPLFDDANIQIYNEFESALINRIMYTQIATRVLNNPLKALEGQELPLGEIGQEIYTNPAKGRKYNPNDFAGILQKYEADTKVQYLTKNMDVQYPVTIIRTSLKKAFVTWEKLEGYISSLSQSLYNGLYNDQFNWTKMLVSSAYDSNNAHIEIVDDISTNDGIESFIEKARLLFLNFQQNDDSYNAWHKVGGHGRPVITRCDPEDIILILRTDVSAKADVKVLAKAFNLEKSDFLASNIYTVKDFSIYDYDEYNNKYQVYDGSNIYGIMCDRRWFKINPQEMYLQSQENANNRSIQSFLNFIGMYEYSLFANAVIFASSEPEVNATSISFQNRQVTLEPGKVKYLSLNSEPGNANDEVTFSVDEEDLLSIEKIDNKTVKLTGKAEGEAIIYARTSSNLEAETSVNVVELPIDIQNISFGTTKLTVDTDTPESISVDIFPTDGNESISYTSTNENIFTVTKTTNSSIIITGTGIGEASLIATTGRITKIVKVNVIHVES